MKTKVIVVILEMVPLNLPLLRGDHQTRLLTTGHQDYTVFVIAATMLLLTEDLIDALFVENIVQKLIRVEKLLTGFRMKNPPHSRLLTLRHFI